MDDAGKKMIENLETKTKKSLAQWILIVQKENFEKHGEIIKFLKDKHQFTHGFANLVAHKARKSDAGSAENVEDLITAQYKGKEQFIPIYDKLLAFVSSLGEDVEIAPKKSYVSLRRKKQFACLNPATKTRFEVGLNLKGIDPIGILEPSKNAMFTHRINLQAEATDLTKVKEWLTEAYNKAG